jgi:predicted Zn-dependent protease
LSEQGELVRARRVVHGAGAAGLEHLAGRLKVGVEAAERRQSALEAVEHARALLVAGREAEGQQELERAGNLDPAHGRAWLMLADRRRLAGDTLGAETALARGRSSEDPEVRAEAAGVTGMMELGRKRPRIAAERFREAQRLSPRRPQNYVLEARALLSVGDRVGARAALTRGLAALPGDPQLSAILAQMGPG